MNVEDLVGADDDGGNKCSVVGEIHCLYILILSYYSIAMRSASWSFRGHSHNLESASSARSSMNYRRYIQTDRLHRSSPLSILVHD